MTETEYSLFQKVIFITKWTEAQKAAGVKRIRIHDLRHSHVSLLINQGYQAAAIADRVGHETAEITDRYTHIYPSKQNEMANTLDELWKERK